MATITKQGNLLKVASPYNADFVTLLKEKVPYASRSWQKPFWMVDAKYLDTIKDVAELYFDTVDVIHDSPQNKVTRQRILVEYLGRCHGEDFQVAYANCLINGSWSLRISEKVLRDYFEGTPQQTESPVQVTLYGILGAKQGASADELKSAFRRAAMTWHPDRNSDADAAEMFKKVKQAWDLLSDPLKRTKYDVGLKLMAQQEQVEVQSWQKVNLSTTSDYGYRAPANCGWIDCEVEAGLKNTMTKIHTWEDDIQLVGGIKLVRVAYWTKPKTDEWSGKQDKGQLVTKWEQI